MRDLQLLYSVFRRHTFYAALSQDVQIISLRISVNLGILSFSIRLVIHDSGSLLRLFVGAALGMLANLFLLVFQDNSVRPVALGLWLFFFNSLVSLYLVLGDTSLSLVFRLSFT
jgi:hypothetical protein